MKHLIRIFLFICLAGSVTPAHASGSSYGQLVNYLDRVFPGRQQPVAEVSAFNGNRIAFPAAGIQLKKGQELLLLDRQANTPFYLLPPIGVLRVDGRINGTCTARQIAAWSDKKPEPGDPIVTPASPTIYLYSNIKNRDAFAPYQELLRALIANDYEVVELQAPGFEPLPGKYGIVLRMEGVDHSLTTKLQSLYSGMTLFSDTQAYEPDFQVTAPAGRQIVALGVVEPGAPESPAGPKEQRLRPTNKKEDFRVSGGVTENRTLRLPENFQRLVICQLDATGEPEFALLNNDKVQVFHRTPDGLQPAYAYDFQTGMIGLHLHAIDLDGDGRDELAVTLGETVNRPDARTTRLRSVILRYGKDRLRPAAADLPYYLRVVADRSGKDVLLGQKTGEYAPYAGDILHIDVDPDGTVSAKPYAPAAGIYSVYQFNLIPAFPDKVMLIEPSGHVSVYDTPSEKLESVTDIRYGDFTVTPYPIKLEKPEFQGGFEKITAADYYAPRRFVMKPAFDHQAFTIDKQRQTVKGVNKLKRFFSDQRSRDSLVALKWTGQSIRQTWESEKLSRDLLDFSFMPGKDTLCLLVKDAQGYAIETAD